jgi:hypothetical protein
MLLRKILCCRKLRRLKVGFQATKRLTLLNTRVNLKLWRMLSTQSCRRYTLKEEPHQEQEASPEVLVSLEEHLEDSQEVHLEAQLVPA